eukprot:Selendium_serpulae@DN6664_c0_g1_i1.p1
MPDHFRNLRALWAEKRRLARKLAEGARSYLSAVADKQRQIREREQKERMQVLKENDIEKYYELVRATKNTRLQEILSKTESLLKDMGLRVEDQQTKTKSIMERRGRHNRTSNDNAMEDAAPESPTSPARGASSSH